MTGTRDDEILEAAAKQSGPAVFVCVNLQNFKPRNVLLGHDRGDRLLARAQERLGELGRTWRTGGDELIALVGGGYADVRERARAFSWLLHIVVGATEAWSFRMADGRSTQTVPWRSFQVVCTPRCGLAELGPGPDLAATLRLARRRCDELRRADAAALPEGFAPLVWGPWTNEKSLAAPTCPACGHNPPTVVSDDLGWSREHCARCGASYERVNMLWVLGEEAEAGYL